MARNKYPEQTISRILEVSTRLFSEKGYADVTIQDIVDQMDGLTKGAIYHHFNGKEEILEALIDRVLQGGDVFEKIDQTPGLSGLEKIREIIRWSNRSQDHAEISKIALSVLDTPQFLRRQIHQGVDENAVYVRRFIEQGNQDGSLAVAYPQQVAESFMLLLSFWLNPAIFPQPIHILEQKIQYLGQLFQNIGLPVLDDKLEQELICYFRRIFEQ